MHYKLLKEASKEDLILFNTCMFNKLKEDYPKIYKELQWELFVIINKNKEENITE